MNAGLFCLYLPINFINTTIMRKVQLLFVCLMLSAAAFAADKVVKLPKPNLNRTGTVMKHCLNVNLRVSMLRKR